jgi:phage tail-like protein
MAIPVFNNREMLKGKIDDTGGDPVLQSNYNMEIQGVHVGGVTKIDGLAVGLETHVFRDGEDNNAIKTRPGQLTQTDLTITRDYSAKETTWKDWRNKVIGGLSDRRSVTIGWRSPNGKQVGQIDLFNAICIEYTPPAMNSTSSIHKSETIRLHFEDWKLTCA